MSDNAVKIFESYIDHIRDINSQDGKQLKNIFIELKYSGNRKITVEEVEQFKDFSKKESDDNSPDNNNSDGDNGDHGNGDDHGNDSDESNNEGYIIRNSYLKTRSLLEKSNQNNSNKQYSEHYSIYNSYLNMFPVFERGSNGDNSDGDHSDDSIADLLQDLSTLQGGLNANGESPEEQRAKADAARQDAEQKAADAEAKKAADAEAKAKEQEEEDKLTREENDRYNKLLIRVGVVNQGYTEWEVWLDKEVGKSEYDSVISKLKSGNFGDAYEVANRQNKNKDGNSTNEMFIVKSVETYINKNQPNDVPPFFGFGRFSFSAGSTEGKEESTTLMLCTLPLDMNKNTTKLANAQVNSSKVLLKSQYRLLSLDKFMRGYFSKFIDVGAAAVGKVIGIDNTKNNQDEDDSISSEINKFLKNKFRTKATSSNTQSIVGDGRDYDVYKDIVEFIDKELKNKSIEPMKNANVSVDNNYVMAIKSSKAFVIF